MLKFLKHILIIFLVLFICPSWAFSQEVLTWHDCIREAAKNHPDLIASQEQVKQKEAAKKITASTLYPQVNSSASGSTARADSDSGPSSTADNYNYGVTGSQLIFDGAQTINNVNAASQNIQAAKESFLFTSVTVRFRLRSAFINLLKTQEALRINQEIYDIRRGNLELITLRYQSGLEHRGALLTAEADLANAQYLISQAQRNVEVAERQLTKEMGRKELTPMRVEGVFEIKDAGNPKPDFELLVKNNPSLQQIVAQKNSAQFSLKSAYGSFFPTLSGQAGANKNGSHWSPKGDEWNLGLNVSLPIFEGGLRLAQVSQAKALLSQLQENERSTKDGLVSTLEQTWAALQDAMQNMNVQKKNLIATQERSNIAQAQYSIGLLTFDNWTIIEDNLVQAKTSYLNAQSTALLAEASWIQAKGETLEYE